MVHGPIVVVQVIQSNFSDRKISDARVAGLFLRVRILRLQREIYLMTGHFTEWRETEVTSKDRIIYTRFGDILIMIENLSDES